MTILKGEVEITEIITYFLLHPIYHKNSLLLLFADYFIKPEGRINKGHHLIITYYRHYI